MHEYEYPFSVTGAVLGYDDGDEGYGDKESTGGFTYDITDIFVKGSGALAPNSVLFAEGYTLTDAMCVFEIGEPRLDTGMRPISQSIASTIDSAPSARSFASSNIHTPLLPEEICWILDRVWGLEMEYHTGNLLAHTVFTFLWVHEGGGRVPFPEAQSNQGPSPSNHATSPYGLDRLSTDTASFSSPSTPFSTPTSLRTRFAPAQVFRPITAALLKSVDLAAVVMEGNLVDTEDFHADMNEVSLVREMSVRHVLGGLEALKGWIWASRDTRSTSDSGQERDEDVYWREALVARIRLRETWLQVLATQIPPSHSAYGHEYGYAPDHGYPSEFGGKAAHLRGPASFNPVPSAPPESPLSIHLRALERALEEVGRFPVSAGLSSSALSLEYLSKAGEEAIPPNLVAHFDPLVARFLNTGVPVGVVEIGAWSESQASSYSSSSQSQKESTTSRLTRLIQGLWIVEALGRETGFGGWETTLINLSRDTGPYVRACLKNKLSVHPSSSLVDSFMKERCGFGWRDFRERILGLHDLSSTLPESDLLESKLAKVETLLCKLLPSHLKSHLSNPSRKRRDLVKTLSGLWEVITETSTWSTSVSGLSTYGSGSGSGSGSGLSTFVPGLSTSRDSGLLTSQNSIAMISTLILVLTAHRLWVIQSIVGMGFELELYAPPLKASFTPLAYYSERPFAYWYLAQVMEMRLRCLDRLSCDESPKRMLTALQSMCVGMVWLTAHPASLSSSSRTSSSRASSTPPPTWSTTRESFFRRYKWAFLDVYEGIEAISETNQELGHPEIDKFFRGMGELGLGRDPHTPARASFELARVVLSHGGAEALGAQSTDARNVEETHLITICRDLESFCFDLTNGHLKWGTTMGKIEWDAGYHGWFPRVVP
ncbi:Mak10 subunit, NatC N-terminal acetyltransferase-domain-containing protein [Mycena floridula]|nr:Mak10 subunit, NatC N-terminal acetyltransferase-domain-containing protein [Mycena floridula]